MKSTLLLAGLFAFTVAPLHASPAPSDLRIFVEVKVKPGKDLEFKEDITAIVASTRQEAGNLEYKVYQSSADPKTFMVYEHWLSVADHDNHTHTQSFADYQSKVKSLIDSIDHIPAFDLDHAN